MQAQIPYRRTVSVYSEDGSEESFVMVDLDQFLSLEEPPPIPEAIAERVGFDSGRIYGAHYRRPVQKVKRLIDIKPSDHLIWERYLASYEHYAIAKSIDETAGTFSVYEFRQSRQGEPNRAFFGESTKIFKDENTHLYVMKYEEEQCDTAQQVLQNCATLNQSGIGYNFFNCNCENAVVHCKTGAPLVQIGDQGMNIITKKFNKLIKLLKSAVIDKKRLLKALTTITMGDWSLLMVLAPVELLTDMILALFSCWHDYNTEIDLLNRHSDVISQDLSELNSKYLKLLSLHLISIIFCIGSSIACGIFLAHCAKGMALVGLAEMIFSTLFGGVTAVVGGIFSVIPWLFLDFFRTGGKYCWQILSDNIFFSRPVCWVSREMQRRFCDLRDYIYSFFYRSISSDRQLTQGHLCESGQTQGTEGSLGSEFRESLQTKGKPLAPKQKLAK